MQSVVSGLNRGLAASEEDLQKADAAAKEVEAVGGLVDLSVDIDKLQGRWKLIYSSAFSSRTLGGSRPGPPTGRLLPITLGQVQICNYTVDSVTPSVLPFRSILDDLCFCPFTVIRSSNGLMS